MKILQVGGSGAVGTSNAGPVSTVITQLANELVNAGHEVDIADTPADQDRLNLHPSVTVHELPARGWRIPLVEHLEPLGSIVRARLDYRSFARRLQTTHYDALHVHEIAHALVWARLYSKALLWTAHGLNWTMTSPKQNEQDGPRSKLLSAMDRAACERVTHTVVLNSQTKAALPYSNVSTIPNGIDLSAWQPIDWKSARAQLAVPEDQFLVTFVGRISPIKGVAVYVNAIEKAARLIPLKSDAIGSLSGVFGDSSTVTDFARQVRAEGPNTRFRGFIHRDEPEYKLRLAAADLVIIPSITEPFGLVVLEALACGAHVVGSDVGGIRDLLSSGRGSLVPPGDVDILAATIVDHYRQLTSHGRRKEPCVSLGNYQWNRIAQQYSDLMQSLVTSG